MKTITFRDYLIYPREQRPELTAQDIDEIVAIVGHGCREKTRNRLYSMLRYGMSAMDSYGIFDRLLKEPRYDSQIGASPLRGRWTYVAGQSYPDEIRTLRNCILGRN